VFTKLYAYENGNNINQDHGICSGVKNKELMMYFNKVSHLHKELIISDFTLKFCYINAAL
jgi:hypothetical protein